MGTVAWSCIIFAAQARQHERIFIADFDLLSVTQLIESKDTTQDTLCRVYLCISSSSFSFAARISLICDIVKSGGKSKTRKSCSSMALGEMEKKEFNVTTLKFWKNSCFVWKEKTVWYNLHTTEWRDWKTTRRVKKRREGKGCFVKS